MFTDPHVPDWQLFPTSPRWGDFVLWNQCLRADPGSLADEAYLIAQKQMRSRKKSRKHYSVFS